MQEYFRQPVVDTFDIRICIGKSIKHSVNFSTAKETDLHTIGNSFLLPIQIFTDNYFYLDRYSITIPSITNWNLPWTCLLV